jgi:hypothetical protein
MGGELPKSTYLVHSSWVIYYASANETWRVPLIRIALAGHVMDFSDDDTRLNPFFVIERGDFQIFCRARPGSVSIAVGTSEMEQESESGFEISVDLDFSQEECVLRLPHVLSRRNYPRCLGVVPLLCFRCTIYNSQNLNLQTEMNMHHLLSFEILTSQRTRGRF